MIQLLIGPIDTVTLVYGDRRTRLRGPDAASTLSCVLRAAKVSHQYGNVAKLEYPEQVSEVYLSQEGHTVHLEDEDIAHVALTGSALQVAAVLKAAGVCHELD